MWNLNHPRMNPTWPHRSVNVYVAKKITNNYLNSTNTNSANGTNSALLLNKPINPSFSNPSLKDIDR